MGINYIAPKPITVTIKYEWIIEQLDKRLPDINKKTFEEVIAVLRELDKEQDQ